MELMRKNQCHYCREALGRTVFISQGHIFCTSEHAAFYRNEHNTKYIAQWDVSGNQKAASKWVFWTLVATFIAAILLCASAKAATQGSVHCADDVLCKDEVVSFEKAYICDSPYIAIEIATVHNSEGLMKAKSYWDKYTDQGHCISYPKMGGTVGDLILKGKEASVIAIEVDWPRKKVWIITDMVWSAGVLI